MARTPHDVLLPRQPGGMAPGAALAVLAHVGLLFALTAAVDWRLRKPDLTASAELWAAVPQAAAPRAAEPPSPRAAEPPTPRAVEPPPPAPTPAPPPPPPPAPAPAPVPAPPPAATPAPQRADADIALERDRREKQLKAEREKEQLAREQREQERREQDAQKLAQKKREAAEAEAAKRLAEAEALKKKREAEARDAKAEEARLAQQREENLKRMLGQAGGATTPPGTGGPQATGTAAHDAAPSASYAGKLVSLIRPNIVFTGSAEANAAAEVEVRAGPSGSILSRRLVKASGQPDWDEAVLRAIDKTARLPRDTDGRIPQVIVMVFKPRE
jgi:colicin import membrane protein